MTTALNEKRAYLVYVKISNVLLPPLRGKIWNRQDGISAGCTLWRNNMCQLWCTAWWVRRRVPP